MINQEELSPEDLAAIEAALTQPDIPLDAELIQALKAWSAVPSYASRYEVLATAQRAGLITEYEYQLIEGQQPPHEC